MRNSGIVRYSPNSEEDDDEPHVPRNIPSRNPPTDQPLDFSKKTIESYSNNVNSHQRNVSANAIKRETQQRVCDPMPHQYHKHHTHSHSPLQMLTGSHSLRFNTPSPSPPPLDRQTNPVLCQILTGDLTATSSGKVVKGRAGAHSTHMTHSNHSMEPLRRQYMSPSPHANHANHANIHAMSAALENSSLSPSGSASPIGLGPLNQVDMHFMHSPNAGVGVDRFGTSGGLLTTNAVMATGVMAGNNDNKRSLKYSSRPFKDYPKNALSMPMMHAMQAMPLMSHMQIPMPAEVIPAMSLSLHHQNQSYMEFRKQSMQKRQKEMRRNSGCSDHKQQSVSNSNGSNGNGSNGSSTSISGENNSQQSQHNQNLYTSPNVTPHYSEDISEFSNGNSSGNSSTCDGDGGLNTSASQSQTRKRGQPLPDDAKDEAYWERRRKNNEAAKRSRDARRAKEDEIAIRAAFLEQENLRLRVEVAQLKSANSSMKAVFYNN